MDVGFKYRKSGKLPKAGVKGTFYYLDKGGDKDELWFCFSDTLIKRVDNELLNADEVNAVIKEYLEKNGISLDGYATEKWVNDVLKKYATKTDLGGYTTKKELETKLGNYAKKDDLDGYATEKWVEDKDYATKTELGDYAKIEVLDSYATKDDVPTKLSELDNDSGYINQIKTINGETLSGDGNIEILGEVTQAELEETLKGYVKKDDAAKKSVWEELTLSD